MKKILLLLLVCLLAGFSQGQTQLTAVGVTSQFFYNANGTYTTSALSQWCVNAHTSTASASENVLLIQSVGATCARVDASDWTNIEPSIEGSYVWTGSDPLWNAVCAAGITPVFVATYNNALYASGQFEPITLGANATAYDNYNVAVVNRLVGTNGCSSTSYAEIYNEENLTVWTTSIWTGAAYIGIASGAASAIKTAQPGVTVITGGVSPGTGTVPPQLFLGGIVGSSPTLTNISGYGLHPYNYNESTPVLTPLPAIQLELDTGIFSQVGGSGVGRATNKPIYITEYGFPLQAFGSAPTTCSSPSTCQTQGYYMAYAMLTAVALQVPLFTEYDLIDDGTSYSATDQNTFGLFYNGSASSGNPVTGATPYGIKPQGTAFQSVTGCTSGTTGFTLSYNPANNVETETFNKSGSNACLAVFTWDASTTKAFSQSIGTFSSVACKDVLGNAYSCTYSAPTLTMSVTEAAGPVIVTATH